MSHAIEKNARLAAVSAVFAFACALAAAYQERVPLALGWVIAAHLLLTLSAGVFKVAVVVLMACRDGRRRGV